MPKTIDSSQFATASRNLKTEILFETPMPEAPRGPRRAAENKEVQIAFYLTRQDAARLNLIHAKLLAEEGRTMSRADRVRGLVLAFIEERRDLWEKAE